MRHILPVLLLIFLGGCGQRMHEVDQTEMGFGSYIRIRVRGTDAKKVDQAVQEAFAEMRRLDTLLSLFTNSSEVVRLNNERRLPVTEETRELIRKGLALGEEAGGVFDITVEPLVRAWGFYDDSCRVPDSVTVARLRQRVDYRQVMVRGDTVVLGDSVRIDLGGIAVGFAVDRAVAILKSDGVKEGLVDAGGDIRVFGDRVWRVGIKHPRKQGLIRVLKLRDRAVATSGDYERFFEQGGQRFSHIIDPRDGYPAGKCAAVTVIAPTALEADVFSTAVFVLGPEEGSELVARQPGLGAFIYSVVGGSVRELKVGRCDE